MGKEGLPKDLRFELSALDQVREEMGLQTWWDGRPFETTDNNPARRLIETGIADAASGFQCN